MFCPSCGAKLEVTAAFCPTCGARQPSSAVLAEAAAVVAAVGSLPRTGEMIGEASAHADSPPEAPDQPALVSSTPIAAERRSLKPKRIRLAAALGLAALSVAGVIGGAFYAKGLVDQRDAALAVAQGQINDLAAANLAFQGQVADLSTARDRLEGDLSTRTRERDSASNERDAARADADSLRQQLEAAQKRVSDLSTSLADAQNQVNQARQDSTNQQQRANNADARSTAVAAVLQLDDQIYSDFYNFLNEVNNMEQALKRYDYFSASAAYSRAQVVSDRLDRLFNQRKAAMSRI